MTDYQAHQAWKPFADDMNKLVEGYVQRINDVIDGKSDEDPTSLGILVIQAFKGTIKNITDYRGLVLPGTVSSMTKRDLEELRDRLLVFRANGFIDPEMAASSHGMYVSTSSNATATANVDISVILDIQQRVSNSDELDPEQTKRLTELLQEMVSAAQSNKPKSVMQRLREFIEIGANTATIAQVLGPLLLQIGQILISQP